jgi:hypothetical protein
MIPCIYPGLPESNSEDIYDYSLYLVNKLLLRAGKSLSDLPSMPQVVKEWRVMGENALLQEHMDYDVEEQANQVT